MEESNVPYGLYKYTGIERMQYFAKSRYNINKQYRNVRRQKKLETDRKIFLNIILV